MSQRISSGVATLLFAGIAICTALSIVSERILPLALIGSGVCFVGLVASIRRWLPPLTILIGIGGLLVMLLVSVSVTPDRATTLPQVQRVGIGILLFGAISAWATTRLRLVGLLGAILMSGSALALLTLILVLNRANASLTALPVPVLNDTVNANVLAGQLVLIIPIALALLLYLRRGVPLWMALFGGCVSTLLISAVLLSNSRGALLALVGATGTVLIGRVHPALTLLGIGGASGIVLSTPFLNMLPELLSQLPRDLQERAEIWQRGWWLLRGAPLTGIGMGTFQAAVNRLYPYLLINPPYTIPHAHHLLLQIGIDIGVAGLAAWLLLYSSSVARGIQLAAWGRRHHGWAQAVGLGVLGSMSALLLHGALDAVTWGVVRPAPLVWAIWGLGLAGWYHRGMFAEACETQPVIPRSATISEDE